MFVYKPCGIEGSYIADSYKKQLNKKESLFMWKTRYYGRRIITIII